MKCLNKSLPVIQEALTNLKSEPLVAKIVDELGEEDLTLDKIMDKYKDMRAHPTGELAKTISRVKTFLERINVSVQKVQNVVVNGQKTDAVAMADFTNRLIQYTEGNEAALTEEAIHFGVEILEQTNPKLFDEMLNKIGSYPIYKATFSNYSSNPHYQTKEGKPDIRKIKKEAIAKQLTEMFFVDEQSMSLTQKENMMTWWDKVVQWFKSLFKQPGFNPFEEAKATIFEEGDENINFEEGGVMFSLPEKTGEEKQKEAYERLKNSPVKRAPSGQGYEVGNKGVTNRVTDLAKAFYYRLFGDGEIGKSDYQKAIDEIKKNYGTAGHADIEHIARELTDENGYLRAEIQEDPNYKPKTNPNIYGLLKRYITGLMVSYDKKHGGNTRFLIETMVYDNKDTAGTIDFIAITKAGKVAILDWKFMDLDPSKTEDVPWYKKAAFRIQIAAYKKILQEAYGIKPSDFIETQAMPIIAEYAYLPEADGKYYPTLKSIKVGNINVQKESRDYLLPVALEQQSSGDPALDKLLNKLYGLRETLQQRKATTAEERYTKADQLNQLEKAVRHLQMKQAVGPLVEQAKGYLEELNNLVKQYENVIKGKDLNTVDKEVIKDFAIKINRAFDEVKVYTELDQELGSMFLGTLDEEQKKAYEAVADVVKDARRMAAGLNTVNNNFMEQLANSVGFKDILDPEVQISMNKRMFTETSKLQQKTLQVLFKKRVEAQNKMDYQTNQENTELLDIKKEYDTWAKAKRLSPKDYFDILVKKGTNELIDQFKKEFYTEMKDAIAQKDFNWLEDNVDLNEYEKALNKKKEERLEYVRTKYYFGTKEQVVKKRNKDLEAIEKDFDLSSPTADGWFKHYYVLRNYPIAAKWESQEWKTLNAKENAPAKKLYDWIQKINEKATDVGYLPDRTARGKRVFLPFVPKSLASRLTFGGSVGLMEDFFRQITIDEDTVGFGKVNKLTGKLERTIPTYFTRELEEGKEFSTDLFTNLSLYNSSVNRYSNLSDIEGIALSLGRVERNKGSIQTSFWGKPRFNINTGKFDVVDNNDKNADLYDRQIAGLIYDQKYVDSEQFDQLLGSVNKVTTGINKFFGVKMLPENLDKRQLSLVRGIDTLNRYFSLTKLGFNPLSALSNYFGGNAQSIIAAGKDFTKGDFIKSEFELTTMGLQGDYGKKVMAAIQYFQPFTDDMNRDMAKKLSLALISDNGIQDALMFLMRKGDRLVQSTIFLSHLRNQIVVNGEMMNARDYVRMQPEWATRYENPDKLREIEAGFEAKVEDAIKKYGLLNVAKVEDGKLVIPGVERMSDQVFKVRNLTREFTKTVLGNMTPEQITGIQQNVIGRSFMVFKNWIPALVDVRYGQLKYNAATDAYEWGRARTMVRFLAVNGLSSLFRLKAAVNGSPKSMEDLNRLYEWKRQQYFEMTGKELEMTKEQFYDMVRENIRKNAKDAIIGMTMLAMFIAVKAATPDDDDDDYTKNTHKFTLKALDKLTDELTFFYNPVSFQQILGGTIFPAMGVFNDGGAIVNHFTKEMYGMSFDEKLEEKNHVVKYFFNVVPLAPMISAYMPLYAPDLAKDLGIKMSTQSRVR